MLTSGATTPTQLPGPEDSKFLPAFGFVWLQPHGWSHLLFPQLSAMSWAQGKMNMDWLQPSPHFMGITVCSQERFLQETQRRQPLLSLPNPAPSLTTGMCRSSCLFLKFLPPSFKEANQVIVLFMLPSSHIITHSYSWKYDSAIRRKSSHLWQRGWPCKAFTK